MTTSSPTRNHPPLAHDPHGLPIPVPEGTTHWRILRGLDTQPARFGLEMTHDDLLEMCGPGTYHVEASDRHGHRIDLVTTVHVGDAPARPSFVTDGRADDDDDAPTEAEAPRLPPPPDAPRPSLEVILDDNSEARRAIDKVHATRHVLRVRALLTLEEQRLFDDLIRADAATELIGTIVGQAEDDAVMTLRRRIAGEPVATALDALAAMTLEEQAIVMSTLLLRVSPTDAAQLIRTYLAPDTEAGSC